MMNSHNQFICPYCQQDCQILQAPKANPPTSKFQRCNQCETTFLVSFKGEVLTSSFTRQAENGKMYFLKLNHKESNTEIFALEETQVYIHHAKKKNKTKKQYSSKKILTLDFCPNVHPDQAMQKIKTFILFS